MTDCIFCKILNKEISSTKLYEDENVYAFLDIRPINKGHALVVPKRHSETFLDMASEDIASLFKTTQKVATAVMEAMNADGFNIGMNNFPAAGQEVPHSHVHIIPRFSDDGLKHWPGGESNDLEEIQEKIVKFL